LHKNSQELEKGALNTKKKNTKKKEKKEKKERKLRNNQSLRNELSTIKKKT
jgi:hypothetical protein